MKFHLVILVLYFLTFVNFQVSKAQDVFNDELLFDEDTEKILKNPKSKDNIIRGNGISGRVQINGETIEEGKTSGGEHLNLGLATGVTFGSIVLLVTGRTFFAK